MRFVLTAILLFSACSRGASPAPKPAAPASGPVALFVGDSLTAGYGVDPEDAWPALVGEEWSKRGLAWRERDAAVSGATSAAIKGEVAWALTPEVKLVFICVGGNDGLRGMDPAETKKNITDLVVELQKRGLRVVLAGMKIPPNYGAERARTFGEIYPTIAREQRIAFMPFLLEGVAADPALNQSDGIHPNVEGHKRVAASVAAFFDREGLLK
ncbi:MAG: arylesterase [Elusimicrobiota bacterium]